MPYPPAGGADTVSRILFQKLGELWDTQFVIDNRGGAGGTIGAAAAAKAERDGYTILYDATAHSVNPFLYPKLPYDTAKDFQAVFLASLVAEHPGGQQLGGGQDRRRRDRARQGVAGRARLGVVRQRHRAASVARTVPACAPA